MKSREKWRASELFHGGESYVVVVGVGGGGGGVGENRGENRWWVPGTTCL